MKLKNKKTLNKKYRLLLINPKAKNPGSLSPNKIRRIPCYPLYCIAGVTQDNFDITIIDETFQKIDFNSKYDLVGITSINMTSKRSYEIADKFRNVGVKVVIGGIHASSFPDEALIHCDSVVIGEAENIWPKLLNDFMANSLKNIYKSNEYVDLTKLSMPEYKLLNKNIFNMIPIQISRGCPYDCNYCSISIVNGKKYRKKNVSQCLKEIDYLNKLNLLNNKLIFFIDDNLYGDKLFLKNLAEELNKKDKKFFWFTQSTIDILYDKKILKLLKKSGCYSLFIGFESLNFDQLHNYNKKPNLNKNTEIAIKNCHEKGIFISSSFIIGNHSDDINTFQEIYRFIEKNNIFYPVFNILVPLGNTQINRKLKKEDRIIDFDWNKYNASFVTFKPKNMTQEELQNGFYWLYHKVFNLNNMYKRIKRCLSKGEWRFNFNTPNKGKIDIIITLIKGYIFQLNINKFLFLIKILLLNMKKNVDINTIGIILLSILSSDLSYSKIPKPKNPNRFENII